MSKKIIVKHSSIVINDYTLGDCPKLEGIFSVYDMITHSSFHKGIDYIEEERKLILPRGIDIGYIENLFGENAYLDCKHDEMDKVDQIKIKYLPRDEDQKEALKFMTGEGVKYRINGSKSQLSVNLAPGKGKTYCSIATSALLGLRSIVITSSINWLNQWKDCILEYTDTKPREIYMLVGTPSILLLMKRNDMSRYKYILASHATIKSYGDTYGWDKVSELFKFLKVGLKFYDEAHLNFDNICKIDFHTNTYKTYYVTATPIQSSDEDNRIFQLAFKNVPGINLSHTPHTHYISFIYKSYPTAYEISECKNQYGLDRNKYINYIINKPNFYKILNIILERALSIEGKTLIYIGTNNAILHTHEWIINNYPFLINDIGIYTSIITENKDEQLNKKIILSTTKSCGAAVDIKDLKMTVVLAEPFKSELIAIQTLGRTRNNDTYYIEVVDRSFYYNYKYYNYKKPTFLKHALSCSEIQFNDTDLDTKSLEAINKLSCLNRSFIQPIEYVVQRNDLIYPIQRI